jgi:hypothetical protein
VSAGADGSFNATFSGVAACDWITATNTDGEGNTSEFSANRRTCITLPWHWLVLAVAVLAAAGALLGVAGSRRRRRPRGPAIAGGGLAGAIVGTALVAALLGLHLAAAEGPFSNLPHTRPTATLEHPLDDIQATLDAYMTQFAETLTAQPTLTPSFTPTPAQLTFTPSITPTPAQLTFTPSINAYCRYGPGGNFSSDKVAMKGQVYLMDGRNADGSWYRIMVTASEGCWVPAGVGTPSGDVGKLRVLFDIPTPITACSSFTDKATCNAQSTCKWNPTASGPGVCVNN